MKIASNTASVMGVAMSHPGTLCAEKSPTLMPSVNVAGLPSAVRATMASLCDPGGTSFGSVNVAVIAPSADTRAVPSFVGVENSHASTSDPGSNPETRTRILSPSRRWTLPCESSAPTLPSGLTRPIVAVTGPAVTTTWFSMRCTVAAASSPSTFTEASPAATDGIPGAGSTVVVVTGGSVVVVVAGTVVVPAVDLVGAGTVAVTTAGAIDEEGDGTVATVVVGALTTISSAGGAVVGDGATEEPVTVADMV